MTRSQRSTLWIIGIFVLILLLGQAATAYTNWLWMGSVGQAAVFAKLFWTRIGLGLFVGVLFFAWLWGNLRLARRAPAEDVVFIGKRLLPDEDREQIERFAGKALFIFALIGALYAAMQAGGQAFAWLQFSHAVPFNTTDPLFHRDAGFYVFRLPFLVYLYRTVMSAVVVTFIASLLVHLYMENLRMVGSAIHANPWARRHLLSLLALALILKVWGYRLAQYNLLYSSTGKVFWGASYADVAGRLPVLWGMMVLALVAAVLVLLSIRRRDFKLVGWPIAILLVVSFVGGNGYPAALQRLVVIPNQLVKEQPFLNNNIVATRAAFGVDKLARTTYDVKTTISPEALRSARQTLKSVRLWDYRPLEATFDMQQTLRPYYTFPGVDVDRYRVRDELRQVSISVRQLDYAKLAGGVNWQNQHLFYTHGYGAVVSPVNETDASGLPYYWLSGIPPTATVPQMDLKKSGVYYMSQALPPMIELVSSPETLSPAKPPPPPGGPGGPGGPGAPGQAPQVAPPTRPASPLAKTPPGELPYVLVNTKLPELDYPSLEGSGTTTTNREDENVTTHYSGEGGVQLKGFLRRLAFALRFSDLQILLTGYLTPESRIQFNRYLPGMLSQVAPFLSYDPDPYPVIATDGSLQWICDAYTASDRYPYSTLASRISAESVRLPSVNYLRNSVKVTVDAYNGRPTFYVVDSTDPLVRCYQAIFPTLFTDGAQMPPDLRSHLRYPILQFMIQAHVYGLYHMQDPETFFTREDQWAIPPEIYGTSRRPTEPYYVVMKLPGETQEQYLLMLPFVLKGREERVAVAWMAALCDQPDYGKLVVYDFPKGRAAMGPMQFESLIDQSPDISSAFTLWSQAGSRVLRGNTLMIPIDGGMLYVEPVYLVATEKNAIPQLVRVIAGDNERIVMEPTLDRALSRLFGVELNLAQGGPARISMSGTTPGVAAPVTPAAAPGVASAPPAAAVPAAGDNAALIRQANQLYSEGEAALRQGDLATYQSKMKQVGDLLRQLQASP